MRKAREKKRGICLSIRERLDIRAGRGADAKPNDHVPAKCKSNSPWLLREVTPSYKKKQNKPKSRCWSESGSLVVIFLEFVQLGHFRYNRCDIVFSESGKEVYYGSVWQSHRLRERKRGTTTVMWRTEEPGEVSATRSENTKSHFTVWRARPRQNAHGKGSDRRNGQSRLSL